MSKLVKNSLGYDSNLFVYQDKEMFNYSIDTILLGNFVSLKQNISKILEVGTNNGALSIFIAERSENIKIDAIEILKKAIKIAKKNVDLNKKQKIINLIHQDFNVFTKQHNQAKQQKYDSIISNPPFYKVGATIKRKGSDDLYVATHEVKLDLEELISGSSKIIKSKGYLTIVLPTERIVDAFEYMRKYKFEPKRVQMIYPRIDKKSNLVLIEARFHSGWGVHFLPNIYLHSQDKSIKEYRDEVKKLYKPIKIAKGKTDD